MPRKCADVTRTRPDQNPNPNPNPNRAAALGTGTNRTIVQFVNPRSCSQVFPASGSGASLGHNPNNCSPVFWQPGPRSWRQHPSSYNPNNFNKGQCPGGNIYTWQHNNPNKYSVCTRSQAKKKGRCWRPFS